ncbi:MAG TPA: alpha/beta hydrolase [Gemmatimonadaceae bacterium]
MTRARTSILFAAIAATTLTAGAAGAVPPSDAAGTPLRVHETFHVGMLRVDHVGAEGGTPIIFIPALFCGPWQWQREIAALSDRYDIYALTLPGFDGEPAVAGGDLMNRAVADLSRLIAARHLDRPIVVGHSLGGTLAVLFAEGHPRDVRNVIAVEGGHPVAPTPEARRRHVEAAVAPYVGIDRADFASVLRAHVLQYLITSKASVDSVERLAARSDPAAVVQWMRDALLLDLTPGLRNIGVPFTEIVPFDSTIDPYRGYASLAAKRAAYTRWVEHAPEGTVIMIDGARHFVMLDRPDEFDRVLYEAIARSS